MHHRKFFGIGLLAAALFFSLGASAMTPEEEADLRFNCWFDYLRFCFPLDPDGVEVEQCFESHLKDMTLACNTSIQRFLKKNPRGRKQKR